MRELRSLLDRVRAGKVSKNRAAQEVGEAARDLVKTMGVAGPPGDLANLMSCRSIHRVQKVSIPEDGILYSIDDRRLAVDLKDQNSPARDRFTCAHEIGHTYFLQGEGDSFPKLRIAEENLETPKGEDRIEETLCDVFAGEVLLPTDFMRRRIMRDGWGWESVFRIQRETRNSLTSCALRGIHSGFTRSLLISWRLMRFHQGVAQFRIEWQAGSPALASRVDVLRELENTDLLTRALTAPNSRRIVIGKMLLPLTSADVGEVYTESFCTNKANGSVLTICVFDRHAEFYGSLAAHWPRPEGEQLELF